MLSSTISKCTCADGDEAIAYGIDFAAHVGIIEVFRPALQKVPKGGLALFVAHAVTSRGNLLEFAVQLGLALLMQTQTAFAPAHIEAVAKKLQSAYVGALGLLAVDI